MKTLYVHIGTMKTGSTAIQVFLEGHREYLEEHNYGLPNLVIKYPEKPMRRNGVFLSVAAKLNGEVNEEYDCEIVNRQIAVIDNCFKKYDNVLLTEETAWQHIAADRKDVWTKLVNHYQEMGVVVKVVVYLRRQDHYVESYWRQAVKHSKYRCVFPYLVETKPKKIKMDYLSNLNDIAETVGKENIIVRRYQREDLLEGDVVIDFLTSVGLPVDDVKEEILQADISNSSLSNNAAEIARILNSTPNLTRVRSRRFKPYLRDVSEIEDRRDVQTSMFSVDEAKALVGHYIDSNNRIAEEYIHDGRPLFNDAYKNGEKWTANNPNFVPDIIRFVGSALTDMLDKIEEQDRRIKELEKANRSTIRYHIRKHKSSK